MSNISGGFRDFGFSRRGTVKGKDLEATEAAAKKLRLPADRLESAKEEDVHAFQELAVELDDDEIEVIKLGDDKIEVSSSRAESTDSPRVAWGDTDARTEVQAFKDPKRTRRNAFRALVKEVILLRRLATVIACGSENTTSDRDYTKVLPGVTSSMQHLPGRNDLAEMTQKWEGIVADIDKQDIPNLTGMSASKIAEMTDSERGFELPDDLGGRRESLTPSQRDNALKALKSCGYNWFTAVSKFSDTSPQLLRDIRSVEMSYTNDLNQALILNFKNVSEADFVTVLNNTTETIFGSETGTLFDTNYYTAHSILKEGIEITNPESKAKIDTVNATQALKKLAINMLHMADLQGTSASASASATGPGDSSARAEARDEFMAMASSITEGMPADEASKVQAQYANAWDGALAREDAINSKKDVIRAEITNEIAELRAEIGSGDLYADTVKVKKARIDRLQQSITNDSELEMKAMNRLYESRLETAQDQFNEMSRIDERLSGMLYGMGVGSAPIKLLLDAIHTANKGEVVRLATELELDPKKQAYLEANVDVFQNALVESQISQMRALDFANEPYLSGNTVNSIVAGVQMGKAHEAPENLEKASNKFPILKAPVTWRDSMVENFGDFVKDESHYHGHPDEFLFRGSKYLFRMAFSAQTALTQLGQTDSKLKSKVDALTTMAGKLQDIRGADKLTSVKITESLEKIKSAASEIGLELPADATPEYIVPLLHNLAKEIMMEVSVETMKGR